MTNKLSRTKWDILLEEIESARQAHVQFHFKSFYDLFSPSMCSIALKAHNHLKNTGNVWGFPYDHNLISTIPHYINASPMEFNDRRYIATQGPRKNTFNEFWHMVEAENVYLIVSVTNEIEDKGGKNHSQFERFWPSLDSILHSEDIIITLQSERLLKEWRDGRQEKIRERNLLLKTKDVERSIVHLHMENWPDDGVVHPESLLELALCSNQVEKKGSIVVHCAAGVGRTGTFIAFHSLYNDLLGQLSKPHIYLDITARIHEMRRLRWGAMIADIRQYELLIETLILVLRSKAEQELQDLRDNTNQQHYQRKQA